MSKSRAISIEEYFALTKSRVELSVDGHVGNTAHLQSSYEHLPRVIHFRVNSLRCRRIQLPSRFQVSHDIMERLSAMGEAGNEPDVVRESAQHRHGRRGTSCIEAFRATG